MGNCFSATSHSILEQTDGGEEAYHKRYLEDEILGQGEFGVVRMVHDVTTTVTATADDTDNNNNNNNDNNKRPLACKMLRKGMVFKDNTLYSPIKPQVLRSEVEILRTLAGQSYCLYLRHIYESPKCLYMVTEFCGGGEMMEYLAARQTDLRTEDVSRIAFQLLSAIHHCATHRVIHRDIKPENVMFQDPSPTADLRLIDFGSGCMDDDTTKNSPNSADNDQPQVHTTFAGSAFYISPEMFQRTYTFKTDVWSVGATLYVLVAGYPADDLQKAFNIMQTANRNNRNNLRRLPNLPNDMPDSYYDLLDKLLTYRHKHRPMAGELLQHEFVIFHQTIFMMNDDKKESTTTTTAAVEENAVAADMLPKKTTVSMSLRGSVLRHGKFLGFKKYERSLTTLLAAMLTKNELQQLLTLLKERLEKMATTEQQQQQQQDLTTTKAAADVANSSNDSNSNNMRMEDDDADDDHASTAIPHEQKLHVIQIHELKTILRDELKNKDVVEKMEILPNASLYDGFAYHVALLGEFAGDTDYISTNSRQSLRNNAATGNSFRSNRKAPLRRNASFSYGKKASNAARVLTDSTDDGSVQSAGSLSFRRNNKSRRRRGGAAPDNGSKTSKRASMSAVPGI